MKIFIFATLFALLGSRAPASPDLPFERYKVALESFMNAEGFQRIPIGRLMLVPDGMVLPNGRAPFDVNERRMEQSFFKFLSSAKEGGLISVAVDQQTPEELRSHQNVKAPIVVIGTTELGMEKMNNELSTESIVLFYLYRVKVDGLVKDIIYTSPELPRSDDYRLVVGSCTLTHTDLAKTHRLLDPSLPKSQKWKFRALLHHQLFTDKITCLKLDWGNIENADWASNNVGN